MVLLRSVVSSSISCSSRVSFCRRAAGFTVGKAALTGMDAPCNGVWLVV